MPGLVDTHVHVNEPGRTEWEGFETATRAAAAGGVTTILDMPLNSIPPTTTVAALDAKRAAARGRCAVDVGFIGGVVPGNVGELEPLHAAGVFAFKCFLCPSGVDEFPPMPPAATSRGCPGARGTRRAAHGARRVARRAEGDVDIRRSAVLRRVARQPTRRRGDGGSPIPHPALARVGAASSRRPCVLGRDHRAHRRGPRATASDSRRRPVRTISASPPKRFRMAPPSTSAPHRSARRSQREGLWKALANGRLDAVVSDHSPVASRDEATGRGRLRRRLGRHRVAAARPARGLDRSPGEGIPSRAPCAAMAQHGTVASGRSPPAARARSRRATTPTWCSGNPEKEFVVSETGLRHRHSVTPWLGRRLAGVVEATYLRGECIYARGAADQPPRGRLLTRLDA